MSLVASLGLLVLPFGGGGARADSAPATGTPATVTADALPTWQVNGVVWAQAVVGNTVYVTGKFATARPPGVSAGGAGEISVGNLIAYDIRTGERIASFNHVLNGQGLALHATADGSRLYVGGDFTAVDGQPRGHVAAFDLATGSLVPGFAPSVDGAVRAITTSGPWVYVGGGFSHAGDVFRNRLVAFAAVNGGTSMSWAPSASTSDVRAMVMAPDQSKVVIGGSFLNLSGVPSYGMGAVDPLNGSVLPWAANQVIKDYNNGGITSLTTDGTSVFGSGYAFGSGGTFEGSFSLDPAGGTINWIVDCLGDTYSTYPDRDAVYSVGHSHDCTNLGAFPDTSPRVRWQRALATTKYATQAITRPDAYGWNFTGQPSPSLLHWYPGLETGTASGQGQAAWSVVGAGDYIALGGEFPIVNNGYQQGLTRFARSSAAPNKARPRFDVVPAKTVATSAVALKPGTVRLTWGSAWDRDNEQLTYDVFRDGNVLVHSTVLKTNFWTTPTMAFTDRDVPAGTHTYRIRVSDPFGNTNWATDSNVVDVGAATTTYANAVLRDEPSHFWRLAEGSGPTAYDFTGNGNDATAASGVSWGGVGATGDGDQAVGLSGTSSGLLYGKASGVAPDSFTIEAWFKTTTTSGGKLIGFGDRTNGSSTLADRHIYMDNAGRLLFGVNPGVKKVVTTAGTYNDGQWHHVAATLGTQGQHLYVDGQLAGRDASVTTGQQGLVGQWVLGGDTLGGWPSAPKSRFFSGSLDDVAVYGATLTPTSIRSHYEASGRTAVAVPVPTDAYGEAVAQSGPSLYWRLGEPAGPAAVDTSNNGERGTYSGTIAFGQQGAVGGSDTAVRLNGQNALISSAFNSMTPSVYSAEVWFTSTSTAGGKFLGFGDRQTGTSALIECNLSMLSTGRLRFAVDNNATVLDSPGSYRDGQWHQAVITQGSSGMVLFVDGVEVASTTGGATQRFAGYWRVGGDKVWSGSTSGYLNGSVDEVSIYSRVLSSTEVRAHYKASGRTVANLVPTAAFAQSVVGKALDVDAKSSTDPDGSLTSFAWDFGDGATAAGSTASHTYSSAGSFTVTLTVTDNDGGSASTSQQVTVANADPSAHFTAQTSDLGVSVDASSSADSDGILTGYAWDFGDGSTASGVTANHQYARAGTYTVGLTVTDNDGASAARMQVVEILGPNQPPRAEFSSDSPADFVGMMDASTSSDPDGAIASYAWDFGDGSLGTGRVATHSYAAMGTYQVTLTVTDDRGGTGTTTRSVVIVGPFATDSFTRSLSSGWGSAQTGGAWSLQGGASVFNVTNGWGGVRIPAPGSGAAAQLPSVSSTDTDLRLRFAMDKPATGGGQYFYITGRGSFSDAYRTKLQVTSTGAVVATLTRVVGNTEVSLGGKTLPGLTVLPGTSYSVRMQVWGTSPTTLRAKVWPTSTEEPLDWALTATDSTALLQAPGSIGVRTYLSATSTNAPLVTSFDDIDARATGS